MRKQASAMNEIKLDRGSGTLLPFYESATDLIFVGGKGESTVKIMEAVSDKPYFDRHVVSIYNWFRGGLLRDSQATCDTSKNEVMRLCVYVVFERGKEF